MGELDGTEWIALARGHADFGDTDMPLDEAYMLGLAIADGCCVAHAFKSRKQRPVLEAIVPVIRRWLEFVGGFSGTITIRDESPRHAVLLCSGIIREVLADRFGVSCPVPAIQFIEQRNLVPRNEVLGEPP